MSDLLFVLLFLFAMVIVSFSQILFKFSAGKTYPNRIREYLNIFVIGGYGIAFLSNFLNIIAYKRISLGLGTILTATEYIFVAVLSRVIFKEKIGKRTSVGLLLIVIGAMLFAFASL